MARYSPQALKAVIQSYPTADRVCWSVGQIRRAFQQYRAGQWHDVSLLYDSMYEDDTFPGELEKRVDATLKSEFVMKARSRDDLNRRDRNTEDLFCEMASDDELSEFLAYRIMLGVGLATIDWDTSGELWIPHLRVLDPAYLSYDEFRRVWLYQARDGEHEVTPGDGKWILWTSGETGWRHGLIRALGQLWLQKQLTYCDWNRYNVKHGLPIVKAKVPVNADAPEKERFLDDLDALENEGIIGLPQDEKGIGYDVELMEAKDGSWESFQASIDRTDRKYSVALLGSNIGSEQTAATGGSKAAAQSSDAGLARNKAKGDAKALSKVLQEQLLKPFYGVNYGPNAVQEAPYPTWDVTPEEDARAWADSQGKFAETLGKLKVAGYELDNLEEVARDYGFELVKIQPSANSAPTGATAPQAPTGATAEAE